MQECLHCRYTITFLFYYIDNIGWIYVQECAMNFRSTLYRANINTKWNGLQYGTVLHYITTTSAIAVLKVNFTRYIKYCSVTQCHKKVALVIVYYTTKAFSWSFRNKVWQEVRTSHIILKFSIRKLLLFIWIFVFLAS